MNHKYEIVKSLEKKVSVYTNVIWSLTFLGVGVYSYGIYYYKGLDKLNEFGDFISGATGSLWGLAGIIFVYVAFLGQQIQMEYQKIELDLTQTEFKKQNFESSYFNLLQMHLNIVNSLDIGVGESKYTGSDCFKVLYNKLKTKFIRSSQQNDQSSIYSSISELYNDHISDLEHTFKSVQIIIDHIEMADYIDNKQFYFDVLFSQLSNYEKGLLFYYSLTNARLKSSCIKYGLYKLINKTNIHEGHLELFSAN